MRAQYVLACLVLLGGGARARAGDPPPQEPPRASGPGAPAAEPAPFPEQAAFLGLSGASVAVEAMSLPVAGMGVAWVETLPVRWDAVDPQPPSSPVARYDWKAIDDTVGAWQRVGFAPILVLSPASTWASQTPETTDWAAFTKAKLPAADAALAVRGGTGVAPPKDEHWKDWQRFVRDLVERYDGDGKDDMPGLVKPVRQIQILDQIQRATRWLGSADEYLRLLHHAHEAIDEAGAVCDVIHAAVDLRGLFRVGDQKPDLWKERLAADVPATPAILRLEIERGIEIVLRSLEMARLFDALPHVGSGNLVEDDVNLRALRGLLNAHAATNVSVWLSQSPTRRLSRARARLADDRVERSEDEVRRKALAATSRSLESAVQEGEKSLREFFDAWAWASAGTAFDLVRGAARARLAGASRVLTYAPLDSVPRVAGEERIDSDDQGFMRLGVSHWGPVLGLSSSWFAARQMNRLLLGHKSASEAPLGAPGISVLFVFPETAPLPWVAVLLPDLGTWAGEPGKKLPTRAARVPLPDGEVDVEEVALADAPPIRRRMRVAEGLLLLELTPSPVYVYPAR